MTRWEDKDLNVDEKVAEEIHLLKKFHDYLNLEKNELEKRKWPVVHPKIEKNQNLSLAMLEGIILVGLTAAFVFLLSTQ